MQCIKEITLLSLLISCTHIITTSERKTSRLDRALRGSKTAKKDRNDQVRRYSTVINTPSEEELSQLMALQQVSIEVLKSSNRKDKKTIQAIEESLFDPQEASARKKRRKMIKEVTFCSKEL